MSVKFYRNLENEYFLCNFDDELKKKDFKLEQFKILTIKKLIYGLKDVVQVFIYLHKHGMALNGNLSFNDINFDVK